MRSSPRLITLLALLLCLGGAQAQKRKITRIPAWEGPPLALTAGLNNGLAKMFLVVRAERRIRPYCQFQMRLMGDRVGEEVFGDFLGIPARKLFYQGRMQVKSDGNRWTEYRWVAEADLEFGICYPVEHIGPKWLKYFKKHKYSFDNDNLPHVLVLARSAGKEFAYPLRDISGLKDPIKALLLDDVPLEPGAPRGPLVQFLAKKLRVGTVAKKREAIRQLSAFPRSVLLPAVQPLLAARTHPDKEVARAAEELCAKLHFASAQEIQQAITLLGTSSDEKALRKALTLVKGQGPTLRFRARGALQKLLEKKHLSTDLRAKARNLLDAWSGPSPHPPRSHR